jgi:hypothetical protein
VDDLAALPAPSTAGLAESLTASRRQSGSRLIDVMQLDLENPTNHL